MCTFQIAKAQEAIDGRQAYRFFKGLSSCSVSRLSRSKGSTLQAQNGRAEQMLAKRTVSGANALDGFNHDRYAVILRHCRYAQRPARDAFLVVSVLTKAPTLVQAEVTPAPRLAQKGLTGRGPACRIRFTCPTFSC